MKAILLLAVLIGISLAEQNWPRIECGAFDANQYYSLNPDVQRAGINPLDHYVNFGHSENRQLGVRDSSNQLYSGTWSDLGYKAYHADIDSRWDGSSWQHYQQFGRNENRNICVRF